MTVQNDAKPSRRRFALSLRVMMALVVLIGVPLAWKINRARAQRKAIEAMKRIGASISYRDEYSNGQWIPNSKPRGPEWLRKRLGDEYFREVVLVQIDDEPSTEDRLAPIVALPDLEELDGFESGITDAELVYIKQLTNLKRLNLYKSKVTDSGLAHLKGLNNLRELKIDRSPITDAGLAHLASLVKLEKLSLKSDEITDAGLVKIAGLTELRELNLFDTKVTDAGLIHLRNMKHLSVLNLKLTQASGSGLFNLGDPLKLRELKLSSYPSLLRDSPNKPKLGFLAMVLAARDKKAALEREQAERQEVERKKALLDLQMRALARFKNLEILVLDGETSWRLAELQDLTKLKEFHVQGHSLKDSDVVYLQGMVDMEILDLAVSDISDAGLVYLHGMSRLRELDVSYTKVTAEGEANLKRVLPSVRIRRK